MRNDTIAKFRHCIAIWIPEFHRCDCELLNSFNNYLQNHPYETQNKTNAISLVSFRYKTHFTV